jgi:hypothetical protein
MGEHELEVADGVEGGDLAGEMVFPVGLVLGFGDYGAGGEDAVPEGVDRGRECLTFGGRPRGRGVGAGRGLGEG